MLAVVSWLGGAVSILPFAVEWFDLDPRTGDAMLLAAVASGFALGLTIHFSAGMQHALVQLAGPPERPARALVLVAVLAAAGAATMLAAAVFLGSG
jgi:hypothetical protein